MKSSPSFFQPVVSTLGLAVSLIVAILPLFNNSLLSRLFINSELSELTAFLTFIIGIAIVWQIIEFQPLMQPKIFKWEITNPYAFIWILIPITIVAASFYMYVGITYVESTNHLLQTAQALSYLFFFLLLIAMFSLLFGQTKLRFSSADDKEKFPLTVFETLERNRIIRPYIEIHENRWATQEEIRNEGIEFAPGPCRKIKIKTVSQKEEIIEFIITNDGKEFVKILKREDVSA